jgi:elongation factor Ts
MAISAKLIKELRTRTGAPMGQCKKALQETEGDLEAATDWLKKKSAATAAKKADRTAAEGLVALHTADDGQLAVLVEVNAETDFVAKNESFQAFVEQVAAHIATEAPADVEALLAQDFTGGAGTVGEALQGLIGTIGENIVIRRFVRSAPAGDGFVAAYRHFDGRTGVLVTVETGSADAGADADLRQFGQDCAMQIAAMAPPYLSVEGIPESELQRQRDIAEAQVREMGKPENLIGRIAEGKLRAWYGDVVLLEQASVKHEKGEKVGKLLSAHAKRVGADVRLASFARIELGEGIEKKEDDFAAEVARLAGGA